ncbi:scavenger receptor cysteine-rich type 1 protein M130-like [Apteryx mantelli]|uniref:Scavenger receptor cysteine-rich type 1 protein M130-like n=1 Tax=Apteryx mantelli TaxID=2696672 RepID=A0ABM4FIR8_9AVES
MAQLPAPDQGTHRGAVQEVIDEPALMGWGSGHGKEAFHRCCSRHSRAVAGGPCTAAAWGLGTLLTIPMSLFEGAAEVRLEAGGRRCAGRVEVKHQDQWGTVCDDYWDMKDAAVVCKQLGCGSALQALSGAPFGPGSGQIWLSDLECQGTETALSECKHAGWGGHNCYHAWDAGVVCSGFVQLVGGANPCSGRVEIRDGDQWRTVCDSHFGLEAADVICRELQCGTVLSIPGAAHFGEGVGAIWDEELQCVGNESVLSSCPRMSLSNQTCTHANDAGVTCTLFEGAAEVRLEAGGSRCAGRVEVKHQGQWGTVCDDGWDMKDAAVVCKQLGCESALQALEYAHFGPGSGPIWLSDLECQGTETALSECKHDDWSKDYCYHAEDAGVVCSGFVQLVGGANPCSGRVEIRDGDQWRTVCDSHFGLEAADVICRELQCGTVLSIPGAAHFGEGVGAIWDEELQCVGNESLLSSCPRMSLSNQTCTHANDAGVTCTQYTGFRLVNGSTVCSGRVEIQVLGTWGTLCDSHWDISDAHVLCHHLNCGFAESVPGGGHFGRGTGPVWRDTFHCEGTESHLGQCPVTALGASSCSHDNVAGVFCSGPRSSESLWLVGGGSRCDGRVEMLLHGTWVRVLDDQWDVNDASVVCRQLQCGEAERAYNPPKSERGTGPVGLRRVQCAGRETRLTLCNTSLPEAVPEGIAEDVGVVCSGSRRVRLVNGTGRCAGRVEIYYEGTWGTVCDDSWDLSDATVLCRQLGCGVAVEVTSSARYGEGSGHIWLDEVNCSGGEAALWDCPAEAWGQHNCMHKEDAGVVCSEFTALRLEKSDGCSGRLQVFYNGTWGSVCSNSMTPDTMSLVCKQLGCGDEGFPETDLPYGRVSGPTWLDRVECGKMNSSFWQCPSAPWKLQSCDYQQDETRITCSGRRPEATPAPVAKCPNSTSCTEMEKIRAVGGEDRCSGRVEVWHRGSWGTVCDDSWDMKDAEVACRQLGCGPAVSALGEAAFGKGTGPIWLERVECRGTERSLWDCCTQPGDSGACQHKEDAAVNCSAAPRTTTSPPRADLTQGRVRDSGRISVPVVICIILGALLCLLLALLVGQVRSARAQRRGSRRSLEPFSEAVYQEIDYSLTWEKQAMFGGSLTKLQPEPGDSEEEDGPGSASDVPVLPRGDPADSYDDAREIPDPGEDVVPGQRDWEVPREAEEGNRPVEDDAEEASLTHPHEDTKAERLDPGAQRSLSPGPGEPTPAMRLGAPGMEERSVQLGEP